MNKLEKAFSNRRGGAELSVIMQESSASVQSVMDKLKRFGATITDLSAGVGLTEQEEPVIHIRFAIKKTVLKKQPLLLSDLREIPGVLQVSYRLSESSSRRKKKIDAISNDIST